MPLDSQKVAPRFSAPLETMDDTSAGLHSNTGAAVPNGEQHENHAHDGLTFCCSFAGTQTTAGWPCDGVMEVPARPAAIG